MHPNCGPHLLVAAHIKEHERRKYFAFCLLASPFFSGKFVILLLRLFFSGSKNLPFQDSNVDWGLLRQPDL